MSDGELQAMRLPSFVQGVFGDGMHPFGFPGRHSGHFKYDYLSKGAPPRSWIEAAINASLVRTAERRDVMFAWVEGHIGIEGNEKADHRASFESHLGVVRGSTRRVTEGGLRAASKAVQKETRTREGFGQLRCEWSRQALAAYTWLRTSEKLAISHRQVGL